ncbi:MAG TPA: adenylate/guanylate cyclase domain-containing protein, partial [Aestuariivirgaceae bacterium]|nr:adenylate/guanylate cyclase domain-containing protein [Aestuariivirgaceae bacterium]
IVAEPAWRELMPDFLERLGHATQMSRVTLFEAHQDAAGDPVQSCRYDWAEPGLAPISNDSRYHNMPLLEPNGSLDDWTQRRMRGEIITANLSELTGYARQVFLEHGTHGFVSVPIMVAGKWWGFLGFDDCRIERQWSTAEIDVLKTAAGLVAAAIERERAEKLAQDAERRRAKLARYFSPNIVEELLSSGEESQTRIQTVTILFADIWGFTRASSGLPGPQVMSLLREFLSVVEEAVFDNHGTLDKFLGDGLMATFGTPWVGPQDATNALHCACQMVDKVAAWNERRARSGLPELFIGVGIHRGEVVLGEIGSERRLEFAVIGDAVNVASRLQEMTRKFQLAIVASDDVIGAARTESGWITRGVFRPLGPHELRGRDGQLKLWGRAATLNSVNKSPALVSD